MHMIAMKNKCRTKWCSSTYFYIQSFLIFFSHQIKQEKKRFGSVDFTAEDEDDDDESEGGKAFNNTSGDHFDVDVIITDWKYASVSSPNADLAYFFLSSTNQSMREKYTKDWLEQYYFNFTECLRSKFGIKLANSHSDFDFDVFNKDFQRHLQRAYLQVNFRELWNVPICNLVRKLTDKRLRRTILLIDLCDCRIPVGFFFFSKA